MNTQIGATGEGENLGPNPATADRPADTTGGVDLTGGAGSGRPGRPGPFAERGSPRRAAVPVLVVLVLLADVLFWGRNPGISLALFFLALSAAAVAMKSEPARLKEWAAAAGLSLICNLPVVEQVQFLSVLFSLTGIAALAAWLAYGRLIEWWQATLAFLKLTTLGFLLLGSDISRGADPARRGVDLTRHARAFALPAGVGAIFVLLLTRANPILEAALEKLTSFDFLTADQLVRAVFWCVMASWIWPFLNLGTSWLGQPAAPRAGKGNTAPLFAFIVNPQSVRNSLVLFNLMFGVQSVMDIGMLTGGMALPEGMSYAGYAHRGAYPLVATALLAGAFAVLTRRMVGQDRTLRALLYLWLGQNLFLVITAAFRLTLYVDAYSLTYLRVAAFIWMALVFVGLILILVQVRTERSNAWLVRSNLGVLTAVLYICTFVNFAGMIASYNLGKADEPAGLDGNYLCSLGEGAVPAILTYEGDTGHEVCSPEVWWKTVEPVGDWREWGFRNWRLRAYLEASSSG